MIAFALTDALVTLGAGIGIWRIWQARRDGAVRMVRLGLAFMGLAALVGAVRFATGQVEAMAEVHSLASSFAAAAGLGLIAIAVVLKGLDLHLAPAMTRYLRVGIPVLVAFMMLWPGLSGLVGLLPQLALLGGIIGSVALFVRGPRPAAILWLAAFAVLIFASVVVGSSRATTTFGLPDWHIYHALVAVWAILTGEATRRMTGR